jgi:hypothetical protein
LRQIDPLQKIPLQIPSIIKASLGSDLPSQDKSRKPRKKHIKTHTQEKRNAPMPFRNKNHKFEKKHPHGGYDAKNQGYDTHNCLSRSLRAYKHIYFNKDQSPSPYKKKKRSKEHSIKSIGYGYPASLGEDFRNPRNVIKNDGKEL